MPTDRPQRKIIRLPNYDYSSEGACFVTLCTVRKEKILCNYALPALEGDAPVLSLTPIGRAVDDMIRLIPGIDKYVIMPNHVHLIVLNHDNDVSLSKKIQYFKSNLTRRLGRPIWQRSYYEYVIRSERDYLVRWKYIDDNPAKWATDDYYC
jgi:REP element-mobilizing transposase RayT